MHFDFKFESPILPPLSHLHEVVALRGRPDFRESPVLLGDGARGQNSLWHLHNPKLGVCPLEKALQ